MRQCLSIPVFLKKTRPKIERAAGERRRRRRRRMEKTHLMAKVGLPRFKMRT